ncbi:MAG: hypothetical protein ACTS4Y_01735, partial [Candidatus Hodgkinia cicadicola]
RGQWLKSFSLRGSNQPGKHPRNLTDFTITLSKPRVKSNGRLFPIKVNIPEYRKFWFSLYQMNFSQMLTTQKYSLWLSVDKKLVLRGVKFLNQFELQSGQHDFICSYMLDKAATKTVIDIQKKPSHPKNKSATNNAEKHNDAIVTQNLNSSLDNEPPFYGFEEPTNPHE